MQNIVCLIALLSILTLNTGDKKHQAVADNDNKKMVEKVFSLLNVGQTDGVLEKRIEDFQIILQKYMSVDPNLFEELKKIKRSNDYFKPKRDFLILIKKLPESAQIEIINAAQEIFRAVDKRYNYSSQLQSILLDLDMVRLKRNPGGLKTLYQNPIWYKDN